MNTDQDFQNASRQNLLQGDNLDYLNRNYNQTYQNNSTNLVDEDEENLIAMMSSVDLVRRSSSIKDQNQSVTQFEKDKLHANMIMIGFEQDVALYALKATQYQSLDRAISFVSEVKANGKYEHEFIVYGKNSDLCKLCLNTIERHMSHQDFTASKNIQFGSSSINIQEQRIPQQNQDGPLPINESSTVFCDICYDNYNFQDTFRFDCGHRYCISCTRDQLRYQIQNASLDKLVCASQGCGQRVTEKQIEFIFENETEIIEKLKRFSIQQALDRDPLVRQCTRNGCDGWTKAKSFNAGKVSCDKCKQPICFQCRDEWHGYFTSCQKNMEKKFQGWASNNINISFCPKCKTKVEKVEGCNHMTCYFCRFQWCWICGGTYTQDHYVPFNPFGCGNQQFAKKHKWYIQFWINLGWLLLALILLPLIIVFGLPAFLIAICFDKPLRHVRRGCCKSLNYFLQGLVYGILLFSAGMALNVIAIPLFICIGIPVIIGFMIYQRIKVHRSAERNLREIMEGNRQLYNY
eukprot:403345242